MHSGFSIYSWHSRFCLSIPLVTFNFIQAVGKVKGRSCRLNLCGWRVVLGCVTRWALGSWNVELFLFGGLISEYERRSVCLATWHPSFPTGPHLAGISLPLELLSLYAFLAAAQKSLWIAQPARHNDGDKSLSSSTLAAVRSLQKTSSLRSRVNRLWEASELLRRRHRSIHITQALPTQCFHRKLVAQVPLCKCILGCGQRKLPRQLQGAFKKSICSGRVNWKRGWTPVWPRWNLANIL